MLLWGIPWSANPEKTVSMRLSPKPIYSKKWLLLVGLGSACIYGLVMYLPIWFGEASMIRGLEDIAHLNHRTYIWGATWELIKAMPITGYGLGTFSNLYAAERYEYGSSGVFVHNDYLQLLLEGGPVLLGLLLAYVAFYTWLGLKIFFEKNTVIAKSQCIYKELLAYVAIGMALSAHALLNYVFYVLSIQLLVGFVLARTVFLARQLGYLGLPSINFKAAGYVIPCVMVALVSSLSVLAVSRKALMDVGNLPLPVGWKDSPGLAQTILVIDPDNQAANIFLFNQLLFGMESAPAYQQQAIFDISYGIGQRLIKDYPYDSEYYWRQGFLLEKAESIGLDLTQAGGQTPKGLYQKALVLNPGNMPANSSMLDLMLSEGDMESAGRLVELAASWEPILRREDRKLFAEIVKKLNEHG